MATLTFPPFLKLFLVSVAFVISRVATQMPEVIKVNKGINHGSSSLGLEYASFKKEPFSYLNITCLRADLLDSASDCGFACLETPSCFSYNLAAFPDINGKLLCELLPSDQYNTFGMLVPSKGHHHFSIASQCSSWPCKNSGKCVSLYDKNSYVCVCKQGFSGRNCENETFQAVFTSLGASGRLGPTSLGRYYSGQDHERQVTLVNGIQQWSVPYTANYRIEAVGAAGGYGLSSMNGMYRGRGAKMVGTFHLFQSEIIKILVGQEGGINLNDYASGGGGGTFVVRANNTPLIIAGGGGGGEKVTSRHSGCDASTGTAGRAGHMSWSGGSGGHGAQIADNSNSGGGGGGFYSSGRSSKKFGGSMGYGGEGGKGFLQGGVGGRALANNAVGGFGGGGGAYGTGGGGGAGGGGGYSGGSSGENKWGACGGGGGSYNVGQNQQNECCYRTSGHGQVNITMV